MLKFTIKFLWLVLMKFNRMITTEQTYLELTDKEKQELEILINIIENNDVFLHPQIYLSRYNIVE